jgi:hypothetical protein
MDLATLTDAMQNTLGGNLPRILGALGILVGGWIVAVIVRAAVRRGLGLLSSSWPSSGSSTFSI